MADIKKQIDFFEQHKNQLLNDYAGQVIVIPESLQVSSFKTLEDGYSFGVQNYGYGNFLLKDCGENVNNVKVISPIITKISNHDIVYA